MTWSANKSALAVASPVGQGVALCLLLQREANLAEVFSSVTSGLTRFVRNVRRHTRNDGSNH